MGWNNIKAKRKDVYIVIYNFLMGEARLISGKGSVQEHKIEEATGLGFEDRKKLAGDLSEAHNLVFDALNSLGGPYSKNKLANEKIRLG